MLIYIILISRSISRDGLTVSLDNNLKQFSSEANNRFHVDKYEYQVPPFVPIISPVRPWLNLWPVTFQLPVPSYRFNGATGLLVALQRNLVEPTKLRFRLLHTSQTFYCNEYFELISISWHQFTQVPWRIILQPISLHFIFGTQGVGEPNVLH